MAGRLKHAQRGHRSHSEGVRAAARFLNHYAIVDRDKNPMGAANTGIIRKNMKFTRRLNSK